MLISYLLFYQPLVSNYYQSRLVHSMMNVSGFDCLADVDLVLKLKLFWFVPRAVDPPVPRIALSLYPPF
jgi:hypothetical protein